ncbi:hypothetical protein IIA16_03150 [bacterium]|nr:hypothetical protein [bacterium]
MLGPLHYLPLLSTLLAAAFAARLFAHWRRRGGWHLLWWAWGMVAYGAGTALESIITLMGNSALLNTSWYIAGAVLGGYPLAQGSVWFLFPPLLARRLTLISAPVVVLVGLAVALSPVDVASLEAHLPSGDALEWQWVRAFTPLINGYAALFLIGGAIYSARKYARAANRRPAVGNALIALGALLPGIGGAMAKGGLVIALYVGELLGLPLIWLGYLACTGRGADQIRERRSS